MEDGIALMFEQQVNENHRKFANLIYRLYMKTDNVRKSQTIEYCKLSISWKREFLFDLCLKETVSIENVYMLVVCESLLSFIVKLNS